MRKLLTWTLLVGLIAACTQFGEVAPTTDGSPVVVLYESRSSVTVDGRSVRTDELADHLTRLADRERDLVFRPGSEIDYRGFKSLLDVLRGAGFGRIILQTEPQR